MNNVHSMDELNSLIKNSRINLLLMKTYKCGVCDVAYSKLINIEKGFKDIAFTSLYINEVPQASGEYLVFTAPTVIILFDGKEIFRQSRFILMDEITDVLTRYAAFVNEE